MITAWHRSNETSKRLDAIPGVGHVLATALVASIADMCGAARDVRFGPIADTEASRSPRQHAQGVSVKC
jgi:transposase